MNIDNIRTMIRENLGVIHHFKFYGSRNQTEEFDGFIKKMYSSIFIIELADGSIRSFSYGDFVIKTIQIVS